MSQHAVASPSGAEMWMGCPGSLAMNKGLPDDGNEYSDEGTAAHLLGSTCLEQNRNPDAFAGHKIVVGSHDSGFDGAMWVLLEDPAVGFGSFVVRRTYIIDDEMIEHVGKYVDRIRQYAEGSLLMVPERRVSIEFLTGEKDAHGTADAAIVLPDELQTHDFKYGMGVRVSAEKNKQLMIYALANREELELAYGPFKRFRFVIHQPRISDAPDEWDCTAEELDAFANEVSVRADEAHGVMLIHQDGGDIAQYLSPSEDACRWCKAKAKCPALAKFVTDATGADFEAADFGAVRDQSDPLPHLDLSRPTGSASTWSEDACTLAKKMAAIPLIEDWCKAVRAEVERQLFAGVEVPGWKIVQGKRRNRQWTDVTAAEELLKKMRLTLDERYKMTLNSPPAIEKVLKSEPRRWKRVLDSGLIHQPPGLPSVAPADDKRPAWTPPDTSNDFTATEEPIT